MPINEFDITINRNAGALLNLLYAYHTDDPKLETWLKGVAYEIKDDPLSYIIELLVEEDLHKLWKQIEKCPGVYKIYFRKVKIGTNQANDNYYLKLLKVQSMESKEKKNA